MRGHTVNPLRGTGTPLLCLRPVPTEDAPSFCKQRKKRHRQKWREEEEEEEEERSCRTRTKQGKGSGRCEHVHELFPARATSLVRSAHSKGSAELRLRGSPRSQFPGPEAQGRNTSLNQCDGAP